MVNPITSKNHLEKFIVPQCCFFFTLRAGALIIGIFQLVVGILWLIGGASRGHSGFTGIISTVLMIASGILIILAIKKENPKYVWYSVYMTLSIAIWLLIFTIIMLVSLYWGLAIGGIINCLVLLYFAAVLRSYAFEAESGTTTTTTTNPA